MELQRRNPNHNIVDDLTCYLCSHVMEVHCSQNGLLNNVIIVISVIIIFFSILNVLPFCFPVCLDYELEHGLFHMQ